MFFLWKADIDFHAIITGRVYNRRRQGPREQVGFRSLSSLIVYKQVVNSSIHNCCLNLIIRFSMRTIKHLCSNSNLFYYQHHMTILHRHSLICLCFNHFFNINAFGFLAIIAVSTLSKYYNNRLHHVSINPVWPGK